MGELRRRFIAATAVALVSAGLLLVVDHPASAAAPAVPSGLSPDGGVQSSTPVLTWDPAKRAVRYEVEVDDDRDFGSPEHDVETAGAVTVPTAHLRPGEQYWRVRSIGADRSPSAWSRVAEIEVARVTVPDDLAPAGSAAEFRAPDPPTLAWSAVPGATSYVVQVDRESDFVGASQYTTSVTSLVVPDSLAAADVGTTYHWHVKAIKASGVESDFSDPETFRVLPLDRPTIVGPGSSSSEDVTDVVLDWDPVPGSQHYQLQVSTDDDFSASTLVDDETKVLGTRFSPVITYDNNQYYWRVRAVDTSGNPTPWSDVGQFRRQWAERPAPVWPVDGSDVTTSLYLEWEPVPHATQYELVMGSDPSFSPGTFAACEIAGTTYTPAAFRVDEVLARLNPLRDPERCNPAPGVRTYWRVRALDRPFERPGSDASGVAGLYSETRSFTYRPDALTVGGVTPADDAVVDVPTFRWDPVRAAESYRITVRNAVGTAVVSNASTRATSYTPVTTSAMTASAGPYTWSLSAVTADGRAVSLVQQRTFRLAGTVPSAGVAPLTPLSATSSDASTHRAPAMSWEPLPGAAYYKVQAGPAGTGTWYAHASGDVLDTKLYWPAVTDTHTWFTKAGQYDWRVTAYNAANQVLEVGPVATFTVDRLAAVDGVEIALDGTTIDAGRGSEGCAPGDDADCDVVAPSTPVISWEPVEDAAFYLVYVSEDANFTNLLERLDAFPATSNTWWAPTTVQQKSAFAESEAGASYYVHVRPCVTLTSCGPRPVSQTPTLATLRFRKTSPPVQLQTPAPGAVEADDVTFDWQDYRATNDEVHLPGDPHQALWDDTGELGTQSAQWYRLQVDDDANFSSPIENIRVDQSTYTSAVELYPEGTLHWRVQAIDADDNDLSWSQARSFTKRTPAPGNLAPSTGTTSSSTVELSWAAQPFARTYTVELYRNGDTSFSRANRVLTKTVGQTAYVPDDALAPTAPGQPYVWRVRVDDSKSNPGPWSDAQTFDVDGDDPAPQNPTGGAFVEGDDVLLAWGEVAGAASYDVVLSPTGAGSTQRVTTRATAWAPPQALDDGEWTWRVTADDGNGDVLGTSAPARFRIDENGPQVRSARPTGTARPGSTVTIVFDEPAKGLSTTTVQLFVVGRKGNLPATVRTSKGGTTVTLRPKRPLKRSTSYVVRLSKRITDARGNRLAPWEHQFYVSG